MMLFDGDFMFIDGRSVPVSEVKRVLRKVDDYCFKVILDEYSSVNVKVYDVRKFLMSLIFNVASTIFLRIENDVRC